MKQKTKVFQLRLTPEEAQLLKEKSGSFHSVSHYILSAVQEFSNVDVKERIELIRELGEFYRKNQNELSWAGGNLNQVVKRANELAVAGWLYPRDSASDHPRNTENDEPHQTGFGTDYTQVHKDQNAEVVFVRYMI